MALNQKCGKVEQAERWREQDDMALQGLAKPSSSTTDILLGLRRDICLYQRFMG